MTGKNTIQKSASCRMQVVIAAQIFWIGVVCLVGAWWGTLLLRQAGKIAELQVTAGIASTEAHLGWLKTQRMLYWESTTFFVLAVLSSAFLFWLYWLDMRRTRSLQAFFASVTHELRTPLTSIRLQAESIADSLESTGKQRHLITRLLEDTTRLESQVERTLELARVEGGGAVFMQPIRLKPWLARQAQSWRESYDSRVEIALEVEDLTIEADPTGLQVIFRNLLENSVKHSRKEGVKVVVSARAEGRCVRVIFRDNGTGYPGDNRELGKLFHKGSSSQGSGVGLYLICALMKRMGGEASFSSQNGFAVDLAFRGERA